jgi:hypothetical protein
MRLDTTKPLESAGRSMRWVRLSTWRDMCARNEHARRYSSNGIPMSRLQGVILASSRARLRCSAHAQLRFAKRSMGAAMMRIERWIDRELQRLTSGSCREPVWFWWTPAPGCGRWAAARPDWLGSLRLTVGMRATLVPT